MLLCLSSNSRLCFPIRIAEILSSIRALGMQHQVGSMTAVLSENLSAYREVKAFNLEKEETDLKIHLKNFLKLV